MVKYRTVMTEASAEHIVKHSKFIAHVKPVETKEEADTFIAEIKARHRDARHNVPAMVIGEKMQTQWASDDGEPQGTAGVPIVQLMVKGNITNTVVVVTRYFGGIKLGTGGLLRAYVMSAKLGIEAAQICDVVEMCVMKVKLEYQHLAKLQNLEQMSGGRFEIRELIYSDIVVPTIAVRLGDETYITELLQNLTAGHAPVFSRSNELVKIKV